MMSNKRRRWFHSSRMRLPFVDMSASWLLVCFIVFENIQLRFTFRRSRVGDTFDNSSISRFPIFEFGVGITRQVSLSLLDDFLGFEGCKTSDNTSHRSRASSPSIRKRASKETDSHSVELVILTFDFLALPADGHECSTYKDTTNSHRGLKKRSLEITPSTMLSRVLHVSMLSVITCGKKV